ncbi:MAG: glucuronate isomerase [Eubacteriales bacterium]|nr:glucuronate isomerase [Eubacteriales bacterium]
MNNRLNEDFFLTTETGKRLYHTYAENIPIVDYHCHLQPKEMYENEEFEDLGEMWLKGDHYKWRVMRTFGIEERLITGDASYHEKYLAFAAILPKLIGNPIYIWCALELKRYFGIDEPVTAANAEDIYQRTLKLIRERHMTRQYCMEVSNVRLVSTTEDPIDTLEYHKKMAADPNLKVKVISAFRPDLAMFLEEDDFADYMGKLAAAAEMKIDSFAAMCEALEKRLQYFASMGTTVSDDGIPYFKWENYTDDEIETIWKKAVANEPVTQLEADKYRSAFLYKMGGIYHRNGFIMQLHIGTYLNANTKGVREVGKSCGFDCIDDASPVISVGELLNRLTEDGTLPNTIIYPLDGTKIEAWAVLAAGFCDGLTRGKVQLGAPWWFNDQAFGIARQFESCANLYPVALSVGMLTDSRSFISYPRHEVYRRILCDYFGKLVERGEYFHSDEELGEIIKDVCIRNVCDFFGFKVAY